MLSKYVARMWSPKTRVLNLVSVGLVAAGMISWIRFIDLLESQTGSTFVQTGAFLNSVGFLFLASQLSTVGVAFYAYSVSAKRASEWERQLETAVEAIQTFIKERKEVGAGQLPTLDLRSLRELVPKKTSGTQLFAVLEAVGMLFLYGWLVAEVRYNVYAQEWSRQNAPWIFYLLNEYLLFLFAGILVSVVVSWIRARHRG